MIEVKAPNEIDYSTNEPKIFLAGSIEMGKAEDWQSEVVSRLKDRNFTLLNPRRDDWNSNWVQSIKNKKFKEQVDWELDNLERADLIVVYLCGETFSPISLLELGLFHQHDVVVCCSKDFQRRGNIEIVCDRYCIPLYDTMDKLIKYIEENEILKYMERGVEDNENY